MFTRDGVVVIGFLPGSFDAVGRSTVMVDITPVSPCPQPSGLRFVTNTYDIIADAPLTRSATIVMQYSNLEPFPSYVYRSQGLGGPWTNIGSSQQAQLYTINAETDHLGYFAAGFPANATSSNGGNQILPTIVAALIVAVLLAGVPLSIMRRRRARAGDDDDDDEVSRR